MQVGLGNERRKVLDAFDRDAGDLQIGKEAEEVDELAEHISAKDYQKHKTDMRSIFMPYKAMASAAASQNQIGAVNQRRAHRAGCFRV